MQIAAIDERGGSAVVGSLPGRFPADGLTYENST
jgi:hypothetical protein